MFILLGESKRILQMNDLRYHLLTGDSLQGAEGRSFEGRVRDFWFGFWINVFRENGTSSTPNYSNLFRQDYVCVLTQGDEIVAMNGASLLDLNSDAVSEHPYFKGTFPEIYFKFLRSVGACKGISIEYLSVKPSFRSRVTGFAAAEALIGLHIELFKSLHLDAIVAVSRKDVKVTQMAEKFGYRVVVPGVPLHNTPCDLIVCLAGELKPHPSSPLRAVIQELWSNRESQVAFPITGATYEDRLAE
jgi:hypothetical protein